MKSRREPSKCREWEKVRRDKLNKSFTTLSKLLPNHDPSLAVSKIDILQKATEYIEELQTKLKNVLTGDGIKKTEREEIKALYDRVRKLLLRNEQLCSLLKEAGIRIPSEYGTIKNFKEPLRWSNKITPEQAKEFAKEEVQKENKKDIKLPKKVKLKNGIKKPMVLPAAKHRKRDLKRANGLRVSVLKKPTVINVQLSNIVPIAKPNLPPPSTQSCFIITNNPSIGLPSTLNGRTNKAATVVTNSSSLITPKMASAIKPSASSIIPKVNSTLSSLGPGTLILANGNIVPILPQSTAVLPPTILTNSAPLLLKPPSSTTLIVVPPKKEGSVTSASGPKASTSATAATSGPTKVFANIKPKIGVTRTTQVNKVPIPALTSRYSDLPLSSTKPSTSSDSVKRANARNVKVAKNKRKAVASAKADGKKVKVDTTAVSQPPAKTDENRKVNEEVVETEKKEEVNKVSSNSEIVNSQLYNSVPLDRIVDISKAVNVPESLDQEKGNENNPLPSEAAKVDSSISKECSKNADSDESKTSVVLEVQVTELSQCSTSTSKPEIIKEVAVAELVPQETTKSMTETSNLTITTKPQATTSLKEDKVVTKDKTESSSTPPKLAPQPVEVQDKNLDLGMNLNHSELSNDIFSSLQVPIGGQNPESTSPTAAFLLAFPLVSSLTGVKVTEVIEEENSDSRHGTPTLLQIGTMDTTKTTQSVHSDSLTPNLLNLDNFSFFSGKDMCGNFYSSFENVTCAAGTAYSSATTAPIPDGAKNASCKEGGVNASKLKVCEPQKMQNLQVKETSEVLTTSNAPALYTEAPVNAKSSTIVQNNFMHQSTSVSYSKHTVSSSYVSGSHYDKSTCTSTTSTCKDVVSYSNRKNLDPTLSTSQYNASTSTTASVAQCNTFNPFSDFSKPNVVHSYATLSKSYGDPLYTNSTHYNYPHHGENNFEQGMYYPSKSTKAVATYSGAHYSEASYNVDCKSKRESSNQRHNPVNYYNQVKAPAKDKFPKASKVNQPKPPINWMTTPDFRPQPSNADYLVPPFGKDIEYNTNFYSSNSFASTTHASYFNATSTMYTPEFQNSKTFDSSLPIISTNSTQRNEYEENQFSWSPTKLPQFLETPHSFVSSTLPTLVGDLALGTTQQPFVEQKVDQARDHLIKPKESSRRSKAHSINYDNQSNFLSVSQLVDSKTDPGSGRGNRRNSGNRNVKNASQKASKHAHKTTEAKELVEGAGQGLIIDKSSLLKQNQTTNVNYGMQVVAENSNWMSDCTKSRHGHKNSQSSYSAEALIGHQDQDSSVPKQRFRQQQANYPVHNKALPIPTFLSDNIVPYFPPVEIPQDNNFIQTNPNYQSSTLAHSFSTSVQSNTYPAGTYISTGATITSSYLQSSGLIPEFGSHDYATPISDNVAQPPVAPDKAVDNKHTNNRTDINKQRAEDRPIAPQQLNADCSANSTNNFVKKSKHKHSNESNLPGLVDFGFLSMPSTINSPILPDDFHTHSNFLPPPTPSQLYPCKNPLYSKQSSDLNSGSLLPLPPVPVTRTGTQHFEGPAAGGNAGPSLTSFNLSAIFPEINKGGMPLTSLYSEPSRNKNYTFQRNYLGGSAQVSFSNKSTSSSSYVNSVSTTYASTN